MMFKKKASVDWTVGKLLTLVLAVVVVILVIWGTTTGGLNPLIERTGGQFNEILILLNKLRGVDSPYDTECVFLKADIDGVGRGDAWLCQDICNISLDEPIERINSNKLTFQNNQLFYLDKEDKKSSVNENDLVSTEMKIINQRIRYDLIEIKTIRQRINEIEEERKIYKTLKNDLEKYLLKEKDLSFFQDNIIDIRFGGKYMRWINSVWFEGEARSFWRNSEEIDFIFWRERKDLTQNSHAFREMQGKEIFYRVNKTNTNTWLSYQNERVGYIDIEQVNTNAFHPLMIFGKNDDSLFFSSMVDDLIKIGSWFNNQKLSPYTKYKEKEEEINQLKESLTDLGELVDSNNREYALSIGNFGSENSIVFYLSYSNGEKYGLKVNKKNELMLVKIKDDSPDIYTFDPYFISLSDEEWQDIKKLNLIYNYLKQRC